MKTEDQKEIYQLLLNIVLAISKRKNIEEKMDMAIVMMMKGRVKVFNDSNILSFNS